MNTKLFRNIVLSLSFMLLCFNASAQQEGDRILAIVGNDVLLESDLQYQMQLYARQNQLQSISPALVQQIFQQMITEKIILAKAEQDSIEVKDEEVSRELEYRIKSLVEQVGSEQRIQEIYGMPLVKIRLMLKDDLIKKIKSDKLRRKKFSSQVKVTDKEVRDFYREYGDSLPPASKEYEMYHIYLNRKLTE
ncbi:MAG: SurA N-terminal domain-containing protein, partial [Ignavibacteria bacterium]|nr:SurA N-terminal domain-containing protein [Ignavibacteria bacterium]